VRNHIPRLRPFLLCLAIVLLIAPLAQAQVQIKVGDNILIKFGILAQGWADTAQDATTKAYANNLFLRRIRFIVGGQISPNVSYLFTESAATQSVVGRDTGFQAKGYLAGGHFEYRGAVFQGFRAAGSRNSLRTSARVSYNPFDTEAGYTYPGLYLGNKHVVQI